MQAKEGGTQRKTVVGGTAAPEVGWGSSESSLRGDEPYFPNHLTAIWHRWVAWEEIS